MVRFLTTLHKAILKYYKIFADARGFMTFDKYTKFCTEFCIFPDLVNKPTLYRIFHTLAHINEL